MGDVNSQSDDAAAMLMRVLDVTRQLTVQCELDEVLVNVIDAARDVLKADRGSVFLYDAPRRELFIEVATGLEQLRFSIDKGIAGECALTRQVVNVADCYADARFNPEPDRESGYRTKCLIAVPLVGLEDELVGVMQVLNAERGAFSAQDERIAEALASQAAVAIQRARLIDERMVKIKLEHDLKIAREIQQQVLPTVLPACNGYDIAAFSRPADETGGDIYDLARMPADEGNPDAALLIMLADATGHGIGPALSVTQARAMFRIGLRLGAGLSELVDQMDRQLDLDLDDTRFITAFFGRLDPQQHYIEYDAPGQAPLLHYHAAEQHCETRAATNVPLGIMPGLPDDPHERFDLAPGDMFVLLTDGFFECVDEAKVEFGTGRVAEVLKQHDSESAQQIIDALVAEIDRYRGDGPQLDDLTAVIIKRPS
jgi:sigma-B regulation protein RsbU (phosphoserine phosphatase)